MADFNVTRVSVALIAGLHAALFAPDAPAQAQAPPQRPNIVIILGDDLGYADMGSFGSEINTPNLDSLSREGVRFSNGKVALHWLSHLGAVNVYDSMEVCEVLHGHGGRTVVEWK